LIQREAVARSDIAGDAATNRGHPVPCNDNHYPSSMLHLTPIVRCKAIEIANALLAEGYDDGRAIRIAIAQAKRWALHASPVNSHEEGPER
jgi:uncharacterized protein YdaT